MGWTEPACMVLVGVMAIGLALVLARLTAIGQTHWHVLRWHHITRGVGGVSPAKLAIGRLSTAVFVIVVDVLGAWGQPQVLSMFSNQSWTFIGLYLLLAGGASMADVLGLLDEQQSGGLLGCFVWALFEIMLSCAILIFIVVWLVLIPVGAVMATTGRTSNDDSTNSGGFEWEYLIPIIMHNVNLLIMGIEARVNRLRLCDAHFILVLFHGIGYLVFSWLWFLHSNMFHYFFIDWRSPFALLGYCILVIALAFGFWVSRFMILRIKLVKPCVDELVPCVNNTCHQQEDSERRADCNNIRMVNTSQAGSQKVTEDA